MSHEFRPGDRWDVKVSEERNGKTYYTRIGSAFCNRDGSIGVHLSALPKDGNLYISPPYEGEGGGGGQRRSGGYGGGGGQQRRASGGQRRQGQPRRIQEDLDYPEEPRGRRAPESEPAGGFPDDDDDGAFPE